MYYDPQRQFAVGNHVRIVKADNPRERVVERLAGVVTDVILNKALVTFLVRTKVGAIEEYSIVIDMSNLIAVEDVGELDPMPQAENTGGTFDMPRQLPEPRKKPEYPGGKEAVDTGPYHILPRHMNRFVFWLKTNGYHRYVFNSSLYGVVYVWAANKGEAEEYMNAQVKLDFPGIDVNCYATSETLNLNGITFEKHDRFVEKKFTGSLNA